ncbi:MAG: trypsin-like peptidase domain-containing protein [Pseudanabaenaceae cyanobacterium SKYGB_i_bin29]|nr:trypsin-like peptidase domain-containing protein [Pseudanabaenaceae cyanobacterium SKYG29]MDW8421956.1 trypsin-like peptidase domain-containing protein [Pseudanabaenaceae cyanobacterium SKYGB_i_bin29]
MVGLYWKRQSGCPPGMYLLPWVLLPPPVFAQDINEQVNIRVYRLASPAVVSIRSGNRTGSGTIVDPKGLVITSGHVVRGQSQVTVTLANKQRFLGQVVAASLNPDLAVVRLVGVKENLPALKLGTTEPIQVGQRVFAIGDPFGRFAGTLTTGIVSRLDNDRQLIQTDAALNPGNSGGPLLNSRGELIGINTLIFSPNNLPTGIGFAINAEVAREFLRSVEGSSERRSALLPKRLPLDGQLLVETLTSTDPKLPDGSYYKLYDFVGKAGKTVVIEMSSRDLDAYLVLLDPRGEQLAEDDDGGTGADARITYTLPMDGVYTLYASSYEAGVVGRFTVRAQIVDRPPRHVLDPESIILYRVGNLGERSRVLAKDGSFFDVYTFEGRAGQLVELSLQTEEFQPYLLLFSPDQKVLDQNKGLAGGKSATIVIRLPQTGQYRVVANAYNPKGRGEYILTVRQVNR